MHGTVSMSKRNFMLCFIMVLVQPRETGFCPDMTVKLLTGM